MIEVREAPVPISGWWWCDKNQSLDEIIAYARDGWAVQKSDLNGHKMWPTVFILSNGQTVIVRAKK